MAAVAKLLEDGLRGARLPTEAERRRAIAKFLDENGQRALQATEEAKVYAAEAREKAEKIRGIGPHVDKMPLAAEGKRYFAEDFPHSTQQHRNRLAAMIGEVKDRVEELMTIKHMWASPWREAYSIWLQALQDELDAHDTAIRTLRMAWARQISQEVRAKLSGTYRGDSTSVLRDLREAP